MKTLYFDCFSGVSGDMILGALVDLAVPFDYIQTELKKLNLQGFKLECKKVKRCNISATKVEVIISGEKLISRNYKDIKNLISDSKFCSKVKNNSLEIFEIIAKAEGKIHDVDIEKVHFHEVGAVDSIVDILGSVIGIEYLKPDRVLSSPVNFGSGMVKTSHGIFPVPAPATLEILKGIKCYGSDIKMELCTPTGAAVIAFYANEISEIPASFPKEIGYGAGSYNPEHIPNVLRVFTGDDTKKTYMEKLFLLEANIDDMNPEFYEYVLDKSFKNGALDAFITPIIMKKGRPACKISVLVAENLIDQISGILFLETTTFGIRRTEVLRHALKRKTFNVKTDFGEVRLKAGILNDKIVTLSPEYEDLKKLSLKNNVPIKDIYDEAKKKIKNKKN